MGPTSGPQCAEQSMHLRGRELKGNCAFFACADPRLSPQPYIEVALEQFYMWPLPQFVLAGVRGCTWKCSGLTPYSVHRDHWQGLGEPCGTSGTGPTQVECVQGKSSALPACCIQCSSLTILLFLFVCGGWGVTCLVMHSG